jgi:type II secretory pathway component PulM
MNVRDWLANLAPRERQLVYLAGGFAAIALLYFAIVMPLNGMNARSAARVEKKAADLAWMQQVAPQVMAANAAGPAAASNESLVVLVDRTGREAGLGNSVRDQNPSGEHGLRLRLEGAPFDVLVAWLASLQQQYGVTVEAATIDAASGPGLVNASLTLAHGASGAP